VVTRRRKGRRSNAEFERKEAMSTEVSALIVVVLVVAYGIRMAMSGKRGRPQGPMI
jgi:hypothetical protein